MLIGCRVGVGVGVIVEVGARVAGENGVWVKAGVEEAAGVAVASRTWLDGRSGLGTSPTACWELQPTRKTDRTMKVNKLEIYR